MPYKSYRYYLPKKSIKIDCPNCSLIRRKTLSRYIDILTGEPLPESFGRCDHKNSCGYDLNPYDKGASGISYADEMYKRWKSQNRSDHEKHLHNHPNNSFLPQILTKVDLVTKPEPPVIGIPDEVFNQSLDHYDQNKFALLLIEHFGLGVANDLLKRFHIGTSNRWKGACIFWYVDEQFRKRGGQIKLFDETFHTDKYVDRLGEERSKTSWVHSSYARNCDNQCKPYPAWLKAYLDVQNNVQKSPCLFGLPQVLLAPLDQPIAIVEAPKTAVLCTPYFPDFVWAAVGALAYLNAERLSPLRGRSVVLFPDLSKNGGAFALWSRKATELKLQGFQISVSDYLEQEATNEQRAAGFDLADYLLEGWKGYPPDWDCT